MAEGRGRAFQRATKIVGLFLASEARKRAIAWGSLLIGLLVLVNGLNVVNSYVGRDFMTSVSERRPSYAWRAGAYALVFVATTVVAAFARFAEERLRLLWRAWTTRRLIDRYLNNQSFYRLNQSSEIDNPDQRITDDVKAFTQTALSFAILSLDATFASLSFLGVLWSITPWLVLAAVVYAAAGTGLTILLGRPLIRLNNLQLRREADLRFGLIRVRESAEPIAVTGTEGPIRARLHGRLVEVVRNNRAIIAVTRNLAMFTEGYKYLIQLIPIVIVAPLYFRGRIEFGVVTQSAMAFAQVLNALSLFVTQFETLSSFAAVGDRLDSVVEAIDRAERSGPSAIERAEDGGRIAFEGLTLPSPGEGDRDPLLSDLTLAIGPGSRLLVAGPDVAAKKALFLAVAGVTDQGQGRIVRPERGRSAFLPQLPMLGTGRLRDQFAIGLDADDAADDRVVTAIREVGLGAALDRLGGLDSEDDLQTALSLGERQLLAFARLRLAGPSCVFLDHVADALGLEAVAPFFEALTEAQVTQVTFAEGTELAAHHDVLLELLDGGRWRVGPSRPGPA